MENETQERTRRHPEGPRGSIQGVDDDENFIAYVEGEKIILNIEDLEPVKQADLVDMTCISKRRLLTYLCETNKDDSRTLNAIELISTEEGESPKWRIVYLDGVINALH